MRGLAACLVGLYARPSDDATVNDDDDDDDDEVTSAVDSHCIVIMYILLVIFFHYRTCRTDPEQHRVHGGADCLDTDRQIWLQ